MKNILRKVKERLRKIRNSGCIGGWEREHFNTRKGKYAQDVCATQQTSQEKVCQLRPHKTTLPTVAPWPPFDRDALCMRKSFPDSFANVKQENAYPGKVEIVQPTVSCRLMQTRSGNDTCFQLSLDAEFFEQLQKAVLEHRKLVTAEEHAAWRGDKLDREFDNLDWEIRNLEKRILEAGSHDKEKEKDYEEISKLQQKLDVIRKQQAAIDGKREKADSAMEAKRFEQREHVHEIFTAFDEIFVESKTLEPPSEEDPENNSIASAISDLGFNDETKDLLSGDLFKREEPSEQQVLKSRYRSARFHVYTRENQLECREAYFNGEARERDRKLAAGEEVESQLEFDLRMFKLTQKFTQDLIEAEASYEKAKAAALAGGVQLSDVDSGFPDCPDDGYKSSSDDEMQALSDPAAVQAWVESLLDEDSSSEGSEIQQVIPLFSDIIEGVEVDDWDAESIEIWDSRSMVAEAPWRKRIDRWRVACGAK